MKIHKNVFYYISKIDKITYTKNYSLIYSNHQIYYYTDVCIEEKKENISYLNDIDFSYYLKKINLEDDCFSLYLVLKNDYTIIDILYDLYLKSSRFIDLDGQLIQKMYQETVMQYDELFKYYFLLQDRIEEMYYPKESYYLLLVHMSDIYHLLSLGRFFLELWKNHSTQQYHEVYTLQNIIPSNFIMGNVVDATHGKRDLLIYELSNYYHIYYYQNQLESHISYFLNSFSLNSCEIYLFYAKIALIKIIDGNALLDVNSLLYYVQMTNSFLLEKYQEYQKSNNDEFKEE